MALVVEDGTGLVDAEAYVSVSDVVAYAAARALEFTNAPSMQEAAIRRATAYVDAIYGGRYPGRKVRARLQALGWPRSEAQDADGDLIASNEVPPEIKAAVCEAAIRELATPNSLAPDLERGGQVKSLKAGSVEVVYADGATPATVISTIDNALAPLIPRRAPGGMSFGRLSRG
jgi:hypothetical protein